MDVSVFNIGGVDINVKDPVARELAESSYSTRYLTSHRDVVAGNGYTYSLTGELVETGNHGGVISDPFESLDYFFERLNKGETDIRCYIDTAGYYIVHKPIFTNNVVHITSRVDGVHIIFNDLVDSSTAIYNSHWNLQCSDGQLYLHTDQGSMLYFENCMTYGANLVIPDRRLQLYGGGFRVDSMEYMQMYCDNANVVLNNAICTNSDYQSTGLVIRRASFLQLYGEDADFNRIDQDGDDNEMIALENSIAVIGAAQNYNDTQYQYGINATNSIVICTASRWNSYANCSNDGNITSNSLVINGDTTLGS